ncbi:hypothetical protein [Nodularia spumigena]
MGRIAWNNMVVRDRF